MAINKRTYILPKGTEPTADVISTLIGSTKRAEEVKTYNVLEKYYNAEKIVQGDGDAPQAVTAYAGYIINMIFSFSTT